MTRSTSILLTATVLAVASTPLFAQGSMAGMPGMPGMTAQTGKGVGVIKAIDVKAGSLTLQHGPIPSIGWPAMTMTFKATPPALLKGLAPGQTIGFDAKVTGASAEVTAVRRMAAS